MLNWLYTAISFIMLRWHDLFVWLGVGDFLATDWEWVLAIIFLVITVRVILFPLFVRQIRSQRAMQALQPKIKELQEKYGNDREALQQEMLKLYREERVNPLMGCLPIFLQVPVFISLFWILGRRLDPNRPRIVEQRIADQAGDPPDPSIVDRIIDASNIELYGWTLNVYESAANAKLFNAPIAAVFFEGGWFKRDLPLAEMGTSLTTVRLVAGVLTILMVITTYLSSRQMIRRGGGWAADPAQRMIQRLMVYGIPLMLLFSGAFFPISVIIYWVVNNLFSLGQQQWVLRKYPPLQTAAATAGGGAGGPRAATGKAGAGKAEERPAVDGRLLAPKPGAKPVRNVPPKRVSPSKNLPPKRRSSTPRKK